MLNVLGGSNKQTNGYNSWHFSRFPLLQHHKHGRDHNSFICLDTQVVKCSTWNSLRNAATKGGGSFQCRLGGYCWWNKSCTSWQLIGSKSNVENPANDGIYYLSTVNWCRIYSINSIKENTAYVGAGLVLWWIIHPAYHWEWLNHW